MYACTCTCIRGVATRSSTTATTTTTILNRSSRRIPKRIESIIARNESTTSRSRLEWDTSKKQWIKKQPSSSGSNDTTAAAAAKLTATTSTPRRPSTHAERQAILQQLKEQRLNEVTELGSKVKPVETTATTATTEPSTASTSSNATNKDGEAESSPSSSAPRNASTSGRRYMRGQDSSTLKIETAKTLHGVPIPIRPLPPESTDCCMSGCPRCVYDIYTEDLQIHFEAMDKAIKELRKKNVKEEEWPVELKKFADAARSKARAAGGSKTAAEAKEGGDATPQMFSDDDTDGVSAFDIASQVVTDEIQDLDISLRTFLKFERELRQRRKKERALKMALEHASSMNSSQPPAPLVRASA